MTARVEVIAHRGASHDVAEHTIDAYRKAIDAGADAVECDVRLTRDGVLICVHDRRIDRTSSGTGVVSTLELAELEELDFASWRRRGDLAADPMLTADWEEPDTDGRTILTLQRLMELVASYERPVRISIETKHPTRYAGLVERALIQLLDHVGWAHPIAHEESRVRVMSFAPTSLRRIHALAPALPTVLLLRRLPLRLRDGSLPPRVGIAGPSLELLRRYPEYVRRVHRQGHQVHVWTVDEEADVEYVLSLGVDAVITNRPRHVLRWLKQQAPT